jgi:hypothetical protein
MSCRADRVKLFGATLRLLAARKSSNRTSSIVVAVSVELDCLLCDTQAYSTA